MPKKTTRIHVNQFAIRRNKRAKRDVEPVLTVKTYNSNVYGRKVVIQDENGKPVATVMYRPDKPLSCGAVCWIETTNKVEVYAHTEDN